MTTKKKNEKTNSTLPRIKITKNGPYCVSGGVPLSKQTIGIDPEGNSYEWREGKQYPKMETYSLCRCGQSKNKPFCDGTHKAIDFDGTETASHKPYHEQAKKREGPTIDLTDASVLCAAARFCDRAGGIWKLIKQSDDPKARATAEQEAVLCPSGRLVVWDKDGNAIEPKFKPSIVIAEDPQEGMEGPVWVRGCIPIESSDGYVYEVRNRVTLCRCGKSNNKPFCDASHCQASDEI
ncbi:MAG: CDGSH iron-sulfur domain-containing protein [Chloroflexota bacterium]